MSQQVQPAWPEGPLTEASRGLLDRGVKVGMYMLGEVERQAAANERARIEAWLIERLEAVRANPTEDAVLDLMDEVVGWCPPALKMP